MRRMVIGVVLAEAGKDLENDGDDKECHSHDRMDHFFLTFYRKNKSKFIIFNQSG